MAEENQVPEGQEQQQTEGTNTEIQIDPYEEQARSQGWVPKEDYSGDPLKWRGAKEFVERGELFDKIDSLGKDLKETRKALKMLQEHHSKVKETEFKRAVEELKQKQKQHLEDGNSDAYLEATDMLMSLKAEQASREVLESQQEKKQEAPTPHPNFVAWVNQNKWYNDNTEMREFADDLGAGYARRHPELAPEDVLKYVTTQVKQRYKDKFENPNRNKPSAVEGSGNSSGKKSEDFQLTDEERKVMNTFVRTGLMSKDDYIAQVKQLRG